MIPRSDKLFDGARPLYAVHLNGWIYAIFANANHALTYWRGLDAEGRRIFHIENEHGERVRLQESSPNHASAILDTLNAAGRRKVPSDGD